MYKMYIDTMRIKLNLAHVLVYYKEVNSAQLEYKSLVCDTFYIMRTKCKDMQRKISKLKQMYILFMRYGQSRQNSGKFPIICKKQKLVTGLRYTIKHCILLVKVFHKKQFRQRLQIKQLSTKTVHVLSCVLYGDVMPALMHFQGSGSATPWSSTPKAILGVDAFEFR